VIGSTSNIVAQTGTAGYTRPNDGSGGFTAPSDSSGGTVGSPVATAPASTTTPTTGGY